MAESDGEPCRPASDLNSVIEVLAKQEGPLELPAFEIGSDGQIKSREPGEPVRFRFHYKGLPFDVEVETRPGGRIQLLSDLGQAPYTAESPLGRRYTQKLIRTAASLPRARIFLDSQDHVRLEASCPRPEKAGLVQVFAGISALLLDVLPHLRFLSDVLPRRSYRPSLQ